MLRRVLLILALAVLVAALAVLAFGSPPSTTTTAPTTTLPPVAHLSAPHPMPADNDDGRLMPVITCPTMPKSGTVAGG